MQGFPGNPPTVGALAFALAPGGEPTAGLDEVELVA
jgi:hypothetical protein